MGLYLGFLCIINSFIFLCTYIADGTGDLQDLFWTIKICLMWSFVYTLFYLGICGIGSFLMRL